MFSPIVQPWRKLANASSSLPAPASTYVPGVSEADCVMMLITPLTALPPHTVPPGPETTSMRSMSSSSVSCTSQKTPANSGE